jgi:hypothetical protein
MLRLLFNFYFAWPARGGRSAQTLDLRTHMSRALAAFIKVAKQATYAASGDSASVVPLLPNTRQLEFSSGEFVYRDIYAGMEYFVGQELVYKSGEAVWSMSYSGGVTVSASEAATTEIYRFLRAALLQAPELLPLRGPASLSAGQLQYSCVVTGELVRFHGTELISIAGSPVYELNFSGGMLK